MAVRPLFNIELCAGSGMLGVGLRLALGGKLRTVLYCEREAYAAATLVARMEDKALDSAPIWDDVATLTCPEVMRLVGRFDSDRIIVSAGYPCQPFSMAGKRAGADDDRHLWPAIAQFLGAAKPGCVFLENVPGHLTLGFDTVLSDLLGLGYRIAAGLFSAAEVGANHRRERVFILAVPTGTELGHAKGNDEQRHTLSGTYREGESAGRSSSDVADTHILQRENGRGGRSELAGTSIPLFAPGPDDLDAWREILERDPTLKPAICRIVDGVDMWVDGTDRLRLTGNGVVPLQVAYAFVSLAAALIKEMTCH